MRRRPAEPLIDDWQQHPERSAAGAVAGFVASWALAFVVLADRAAASAAGLEPPLGAAATALALLSPLVVLGATCAVPVARRWQGHVVPGVLAGMALGYAILGVVALAASLA